MSTPNTPLSQITFKHTIVLSTADENNGNRPISEGYVVAGPFCPGSPAIPIAGGSKMIVSIANFGSVTNGSYGFKIHLPTATGNTMYLTYCEANSEMADGWYDYKTGIPAAFFAQIRRWLVTIPPLMQSEYGDITPTVRAKSLRFSAYGRVTNKPSEAVSFGIDFSGIFPLGSSLTSTRTSPFPIGTFLPGTIPGATF